MKNEIKMLLLGIGESGKSTFVKQMQILYKDGFGKQTKMLYRDAIRQNLRFYTQTLLEAVDSLELKLLKSNVYVAEEFNRLNAINTEGQILNKKLIKCIINLWADPSLKITYKRRFNFQIPDNANVYLDNIEDIAQPDYIPSEQDILGCRIPTTGINEIVFDVNNQTWRIVDVGGQRSERRKWIHQFDDVFLLIYVVAINEYNQYLYEDESTNRLQESLKVFNKISNNEYFRHTNCVVLFNKMDLFTEKILKFDLNVCFREYKHGLDIEKARLYIEKKFVKKAKNKNRRIFIHYSCAIYTENIEFVFNAVQRTVLENFLKETDVYI
ncbi:guanine nucleotide-binding protein g(o) subunit alpha [Anaeramoeba flamelloides]|uniref:Guanine nucleotide-binding protein g(O) subunit alpha n=1 Tax=Anaeramoeba flamelloides TaxID=1746091 RepID=A0AAV7Y8Z8_9EUKA|nr:guanine nucleotide-binding protein g(o) subunit alpha [Anaeramoeba flamelloides]KAJ6229358.1 guanine nucleotide-binding protein g(o) subunit alpha [Anaeramoeba flamelloides]